MKKLFSFLLALLLLGSLALTASGWELRSCDVNPDGYVTDLYGLLDGESERALESTAKAISEAYNRGVYILILDNYGYYGTGDLYTVAGDIYLASGLGLGEAGDGILLLMSMNDRTVALITRDGSGQFVTAEGKDWLAPQYLAHFRENDWVSGLEAYLAGCETLLEMAAEGKPMTRLTQPGVRTWGGLISLALGFLAAFLTVKLLESGMRSVFKATRAGDYAVPGGMELTRRSDLFLRRTTTRRKLEKKTSGNASGGSRSSNSRGFSGRTDRF